MTAPAPSPEQRALAQATEAVELGIQACVAYGRGDLAARLTGIRRSLSDPAVHVVIAGEFKQGKSSLVNGLVGATICPVDDDVATALPTHLRYGEQARARLIFDGDPPRREPIELDAVRSHVVEHTGPGGRRPATSGRSESRSAAAQDARGRPGPCRHPGRRRPRLGPRGGQPGRDLDGRRGRCSSPTPRRS